MSSNIPLILQGKYFSILTRFANDLSTEDEYNISSVLYRGVPNLLKGTSLKVDSNGLDSELSKNRLRNISNSLGFDIAYLQLDFLGLRFVSEKGEEKRFDFSIDRFIDFMKSIPESKSNKQGRFNYSLLSFPYIGNPIEANESALVFLGKLIAEAGMTFSDGVMLVLTGEMLWSGFINSYILANLLKEFENKELYLLPDVHGIWQALTSIEDLGFLRSVNKRYLLPSVLYQRTMGKESKYNLNCKESIRTIYLTHEFNIFDINADSCYFNDKLIPRFLIINRQTSKRKKKEFVQVRTNLMKQGRVVWELVPQDYIIDVLEDLPIPYGDIEDCTKNIGDWVSVNETIGKQKVLQFDSYKLSAKWDLKVFDGQILKRGELIATGRMFNELRCRRTGKVDLSLIKDGIIKIITKKETQPLVSIFSGEVIKYSGRNEMTLRSRMSRIRLALTSGKGACGILSNEISLGGILLCENYIEALKYLNGEVEKCQYHINQIKGLLIKNLSFNEFILLRALPVPYLNIAAINIESENGAGVWKDFELKILNKPIFVKDNYLYFQSDRKKEIKDIVKNELFESSLRRGEEVFFIDFLSPYLYGKIKGPSLKEKGSYLIDTGKGLCDVKLKNIIYFKNGG